MRTTLRSVPRLTRDTMGVIVMRLSSGDKVAAATVVAKKKEEGETAQAAKPKKKPVAPKSKKRS